MQQTVRIPAFDSARALMMLLGILVHTCLVIDVFVPNITLGESAFFAGAYSLVHLFRMPVFFIVGGYFAAYLVIEKGSRAFLVSRFKRLVTPLLAAEACIGSLVYFAGCAWCENPTAGWAGLLGSGWLYLWFLFYLVLVSHLALLLHLFFAKFRLPHFSKVYFAWMSPLHVGVLAAGASFIPGVFDAGKTPPSLRIAMGLLPQPTVMLFFGLLFWSGWSIYKNRSVALNQVRNWWWGNLVLAVAGYFWWPMAAVWFCSFAVLGIFLRFANRTSAVMAYLSDASYWIYLVHPPIVIALLAWMGSWGWPATLVALVEMVSTAAITIGSYQLLIRYTILGKWLSGRRRPTRKQRLAAGSELLLR